MDVNNLQDSSQNDPVLICEVGQNLGFNKRFDLLKPTTMIAGADIRLRREKDDSWLVGNLPDGPCSDQLEFSKDIFNNIDT